MSIKRKIKNRIKTYLRAAERDGKWIGIVGNKLIGRKRRLTYERFSDLDIDDHLVVFECYTGTKYTDSPRAIYEYMLGSSEYSDYRFVWCFKGKAMQEYGRLADNRATELIKWGSEEYYKTYAIAGYWVTNKRLSAAIDKRPGQKYIQCWHGTPLKKLGCDIEDGSPEAAETTIKVIHEDVKRYDYLISPSRYFTEKMSSAFDLKALEKTDVVIETGYPRNDELSKADEQRRLEIRKKLGIDEGKRVILYAPTYRENMRADGGVGAYQYKEPLELQALKEALGDNWQVLFRAHYFIKNTEVADLEVDFVKDVSGYPEINDLYIAADVLVTDYSSVFFDFGVLKRPVIFYMYDLESYRDVLRGLYLDTDELPGPVERDQEGLTERLLSIDEWFMSEEWQKRYESFSARFTYLDDGNATERVVKTVFSNI